MISVGIIILTALLWYTGHFAIAFWLIVIAILNGAFGMIRAIIDPDWYQAGRMQAGLDINFFDARQGISSLIVTKIILIGALSFVAWKLGQSAGYF